MKRHICRWIAPAAFVLDRAVKMHAQDALKGRPPNEVLPGILRLMYVENTGAAFGVLGGQTGLLAAVTGAALAGLFVYLLLRDGSLPRTARSALWLLLGGALGNFFDRLYYGYVIDMFEFRFVSFPVFNVSDICISLSFVLIAAWILFGREGKRRAR